MSLIKKVLNTIEVQDYDKRFNAKNNETIENNDILENADLVDADSVHYKKLEAYAEFVCNFARN